MITQSTALPSVLLYQVIYKGFPSVAWAHTVFYYLAAVLVWITLILTLYSGYLYVNKAAKIMRKENVD
jgi:phosphatidylglycerophosphate synthase